jgi:hypothetical protein
VPTPVATLPAEARREFKEPLGPVFTDATDLLDGAGAPVIAVGDVVTYHLSRAGAPPAVAVVDGISERDAVSEAVLAGRPDLDETVHVASDPATVSDSLLDALVDAIDAAPDTTTLVVVDGEEDLATLPAVLAAPIDATIVYGQPGEGMVRVPVTSGTKERVRGLCEVLDTEPAFWARLDAPR